MLREKIVGTWLLVSYIAQDDQGGPVTFPLGRDAVGLIMYTTDGYMSAQLMRPGRQDYDQPDTGGSSVQQAAAAAEGYLAYSGAYDVDEAVRPHYITGWRFFDTELARNRAVAAQLTRGQPADAHCRNPIAVIGCEIDTGLDAGTRPPFRWAQRASRWAVSEPALPATGSRVW